MAKRALVTGITGQDGSYLTELLLAKGYEVHGIVRRASTFNTNRIDHVYEDPHWSANSLRLHYGDLTDASCLSKLMHEIRPQEFSNELIDLFLAINPVIAPSGAVGHAHAHPHIANVVPTADFVR